MATTRHESSGDEQAATAAPAPAPGGFSPQDAARAVAATALIAAGIIHFAYAPGHLDEELSHGVFFLVSGWLQLALAAGLVLRARPERLWLIAAVAVNLGILVTWVVSRTVGVPGSDAESVGFPDVVASLIEVAVVLAAGALLAGLSDRPAIGRGRPAFGLAGVGAVGVVALVSMAVSPSFAGNHGAGGHGHGGAEGEAAGADHHDTAGATTDPEAWAQQRYDALAGYATPEIVEEFEALEAEYLEEQIRARSDLIAELPAAEGDERIATYVDWAVENTIALLDDAQGTAGAESDAGMHEHGPSAWQDITDPADELALQEQLRLAGTVIAKFPDVAAAEAAGYYQIAPYVPGIGAHWINGDLDAEFDPAAPEMLLFNGTEQDSELVGLSYAAISAEPPEGFVGPNDTWHAHPALCMLGGLVVGIDGTPEELCESIGGNIATGLGDLQMAHLWQVPGWESPWGLFAAENPRVNVATSDLGRELIAGTG